MKITLKVSCMVPVLGEYEIEADSVEDAIEKVQAECEELGWSADIWQSAKLSDPEWGSATDFGIESQTDFIHLLDND